MKTDDLISDLALSARPTRPHAAAFRLIGGLALGAIVSMALLIGMFGAPLRDIPVTGVPAFAMKLAFAAAMAGIGGLLAYISGQPGRSLRLRVFWLLVPPAVIAVGAALELGDASAASQANLWFGATWHTCLLTVSLVAVPIFLGIVWGFERLAPTHLQETGCLAGVTAGATSATLYALYCPETTATFLLSWYTLAIAVAGIAGALVGPRLLRW
ncbi:MAG: DUF1109 domain-containing protein [Sphingomonadales bacterium]|nr:DUF1109 domain-containing protein [Sphingomonadales bacterium]